VLLGCLELLPPVRDRVPSAGEGAQDRGHIGQIAQLEAHIAGMTSCRRPYVGVAQRVRERAIPARALAEHTAASDTATFVALLDCRQHFIAEKVLPTTH